MPKLPPSPEEIAQLMRFIAGKVKNVKSPMNIAELCRQFKEESGSSAMVKTLILRINTNRHKIHGMNEFDMETKVRMMFALNASINAGFLEELKKVADVEVDDRQRIIHYKQIDGGLELNGNHFRVPMKMEVQRDRKIIQLLAEKAETTDKPIADRDLLRELKEKSGYPDSIETLVHRYRRVKNAIYHLTEIDKNTKIKMMFISNVKLSDETLEELRKDADVEVDEKGRITKYKSKDGSLEMEGRHGQSSIWKSRDDDKKTNCQKYYEKTQIDLVRFLINRTKNATLPLSIKQLAKDYKKEFKRSESLSSIVAWIRTFRQEIHKINQFDKPTRVKMFFALSVPIDAKLLKELQKDAIVGLDESQRIEKYKAEDGSLELEGDHSCSAKAKSVWDEKKKRRVVSDSLGKKRARISYSSSEASEEEPSEESDDEESVPSEGDIAMASETNNIDNGGDDFDQMSYHYYNERDDTEDMDHIPVETKPESLIEVKTEVPEEPSGGEYDLIEPKIEECTREVKQEAEKDEEGPSTTFSLNVSLFE